MQLQLCYRLRSHHPGMVSHVHLAAVSRLFGVAIQELDVRTPWGWLACGMLRGDSKANLRGASGQPESSNAVGQHGAPDSTPDCLFLDTSKSARLEAVHEGGSRCTKAHFSTSQAQLSSPSRPALSNRLPQSRIQPVPQRLGLWGKFVAVDSYHSRPGQGPYHGGRWGCCLGSDGGLSTGR